MKIRFCRVGFRNNNPITPIRNSTSWSREEARRVYVPSPPRECLDRSTCSRYTNLTLIPLSSHHSLWFPLSSAVLTWLSFDLRCPPPHSKTTSLTPFNWLLMIKTPRNWRLEKSTRVKQDRIWSNGMAWRSFLSTMGESPPLLSSFSRDCLEYVQHLSHNEKPFAHHLMRQSLAAIAGGQKQKCLPTSFDVPGCQRVCRDQGKWCFIIWATHWRKVLHQSWWQLWQWGFLLCAIECQYHCCEFQHDHKFWLTLSFQL